MRLPGWEKELALGFLYTGGIVRDLDKVITIRFCGAATNPLLPPNVVDVQLADAAWERRGRRHLEVAYAGCGLCAKEALDEICRATAPVSWAWLAGAAGSANKTRMAAVIAFAINSFPLEVLKSP